MALFQSLLRDTPDDSDQATQSQLKGSVPPVSQVNAFATPFVLFDEGGSRMGDTLFRFKSSRQTKRHELTTTGER
jgi:hypothetical protein